MTDYPNYKSPAARQKDRIREDIAAIDKAIESCNPKLILQMHQHSVSWCLYYYIVHV